MIEYFSRDLNSKQENVIFWISISDFFLNFPTYHKSKVIKLESPTPIVSIFKAELVMAHEVSHTMQLKESQPESRKLNSPLLS